MPTLTQCLGDGCATETGLARAARVNVHQLSTSFCRFVDQLGDERRPSGIIDGLGEKSATAIPLVMSQPRPWVMLAPSTLRA